ncbi:MAG: cytidine deaminase [Nocardioidaceae bacterium]
MSVEITDPEDKKILTLARATRARVGAAQGACVRDTDGRTYAAASVDLPSLRLSAVEVAVAMAVSSGSAGLEAVAVLSEAAEVSQADIAPIRDLGGPGVSVLLGSPDGSVRERLTT